MISAQLRTHSRIDVIAHFIPTILNKIVNNKSENWDIISKEIGEQASSILSSSIQFDIIVSPQLTRLDIQINENTTVKEVHIMLYLSEYIDQTRIFPTETLLKNLTRSFIRNLIFYYSGGDINDRIIEAYAADMAFIHKRYDGISDDESEFPLRDVESILSFQQRIAEIHLEM